MIITCEQCKSQFRLDENLLKIDGSKVRCSLCRHVFTAYPQELAPFEGAVADEFMDDALAETVSLDTPPVLEEEFGDEEEGEPLDFDKAFEEAMAEDTVQAVSPEQIQEEEESLESFDMSEGMGRAAKIEKDVIEEDTEKKTSEKPPKQDAGVKTAQIPSEKKKGGGPRFLPILLVVVILLLGAAVAVFFLAPDLIPDSMSMFKPAKKQEITDVGVRRLAFKAVAGSFVESKTAGQLFVIKGMVTNEYPKSRSFILVKGAILDDKGKVVKTRMAYAGNAFTEQELHNMTLEQINTALKNRLGKRNMNVNIQRGASIPVMIVFSDLPDNLSEFTVEAVSSSPVR